MVTEGMDLPLAAEHARLAAALRAASVVEAFREQLRDVDPGVRAAWRACRVVEALYRPGQSVRIAYALLSDDTILQDNYWARGDIVYVHWPVRGHVERHGTLMRLDGYDVEAYCFPNDRKLRGLRRLTGKTTIAGLWEACRPGDSAARVGGESLRRKLIRYVPEQKFVARIQPRVPREAADHADDLGFAMRVSSPERCRALCQRHRTAARWAQTKAKTLHVPDVRFADEAKGLVLCEWVGGRSLIEKLHTGDPEQVMRRMARMLRTFHRMPAEGLGRLTARGVAHRVELAVADLALACPELRARLRLLGTELDQRLNGIGDVKSVTLHDDLHWNQVRIHLRRYALLDLERMCTGDPLVDVANFATQVRMLGHRPEHDVDAGRASGWAQEFLRQWVARTGRPIAPDRLRLYSAASLLNLARGMMRHLRPGWRDLAAECTGHAENELDAIERSCSVP
jgi:aminoglycoside phosphotransferase (APT) family kinase protein